jgi:hypothetical protein
MVISLATLAALTLLRIASGSGDKPLLSSCPRRTLKRFFFRFVNA